MKSTIATTAAVLLSLGSSATAQTETQSAPFHLVLQSKSNSLNGKPLTACHEGADIESLCLDGSPGSRFQFNSSSSQPVNNDIGKTGIITFELPGYNFNESQALSLFYQPSTNVAHPQFGIGAGQTVGFDSSNKLFIPSYYNDNTSPPTFGTAMKLYHWVACDYDYAGYNYTTLNFVVGDAKAQNPSCVKVQVVKKEL